MSWNNGYPSRIPESPMSKKPLAVQLTLLGLGLVIAIVAAFVVYKAYVWVRWTYRLEANEVGAVTDYTKKGTNEVLKDSIVLEEPVYGRVVLAGRHQTLMKYVISRERRAWTASAKEGKAQDESIEVRTKDGYKGYADTFLDVNLQAAKVPEYRRVFGTLNVDQIIDQVFRGRVRDVLSTEVSKYTATEVREKKGEIAATVAAAVEKEIKDNFFEVNSFGVADINIPDYVKIEQQKAEAANAKAIAESKKAEQDTVNAAALAKANNEALIAEAQARGIAKAKAAAIQTGTARA